MVGRVIGKQGDTIKQLQRSTGANIQIDQKSDPCTITITGPKNACNNAMRDINAIISDNGMGGGAATLVAFHMSVLSLIILRLHVGGFLKVAVAIHSVGYCCATAYLMLVARMHAVSPLLCYDIRISLYGFSRGHLHRGPTSQCIESAMLMFPCFRQAPVLGW